MLENSQTTDRTKDFFPAPATWRSREAALDRPTFLQAALWGGLILLAALLVVRGFDAFQLGAYSDDASYVILANSLVNAGRYGMINVPGLPGPTQFPFGYPLLLAPIVHFFPGQTDALRIFSLAATLTNAAILFWAWPRLTRIPSYWWGLAVSGLYLLSPLVITHSRMVMSEPVFTTFCLIAILLGERLAAGDNRYSTLLGLSLSLVFVLFIRTIGVTLLGALVAYLLFRRGWRVWKELVFVGAGMIAVLSAIVVTTPVNINHILPEKYLNSRQGTVIRQVIGTAPRETAVPENVEASRDAPEVGPSRGWFYDTFISGLALHFGQDIRQLLLPFGQARGRALEQRLGVPGLMNLVGFGISALIGLGFARLFRRGRISLFVLYALLSFGLLLVWVWQGPRLLYPIQPQLMLGLLLGIQFVVAALARPFPALGRPTTARLMLVLSALLLLVTSASETLEVDDSREHIGDLQTRTAWIRTALPSNAVLMTEAPVVDYLYSERKTLGYPLAYKTKAAFQKYLNTKKPDYILVAPKTNWQLHYAPHYSPRVEKILPYLQDLVAQNELTLIHSSEENRIQVYEVHR